MNILARLQSHPSLIGTFGLVLLLSASCEKGERSRSDFSNGELSHFWEQHKTERALNNCDLKIGHDIGVALKLCLSKPIKGTILGTKTVIPAAEDGPENVFWYVGATNGRVYSCTRGFSGLQPFSKNDAVFVTITDTSSMEGEIVGVGLADHGFKISVQVAELLPYQWK